MNIEIPDPAYTIGDVVCDPKDAAWFGGFPHYTVVSRRTVVHLKDDEIMYCVHMYDLNLAMVV